MSAERITKSCISYLEAKNKTQNYSHFNPSKSLQFANLVNSARLNRLFYIGLKLVIQTYPLSIWKSQWMICVTISSLRFLFWTSQSALFCLKKSSWHAARHMLKTFGSKPGSNIVEPTSSHRRIFFSISATMNSLKI